VQEIIPPESHSTSQTKTGQKLDELAQKLSGCARTFLTIN